MTMAGAGEQSIPRGTTEKEIQWQTTHIKQNHDIATENDFAIEGEKGPGTDRTVSETPAGKWQPEVKCQYSTERSRQSLAQINVRYDRKNCTESDIPPAPLSRWRGDWVRSGLCI